MPRTTAASPRTLSLRCTARDLQRRRHGLGCQCRRLDFQQVASHNYYVNYEALVGHRRHVARHRPQPHGLRGRRTAETSGSAWYGGYDQASTAAVLSTIRTDEKSPSLTATITADSRMIWMPSAAWRTAKHLHDVHAGVEGFWRDRKRPLAESTVRAGTAATSR